MINDTSKEKILETLRLFDNDLRGTKEWENWDNRKNHKYAISYNDLLYPVKEIISNATGTSKDSFNGGSEANSFIEKKGFTIVELLTTSDKGESDIDLQLEKNENKISLNTILYGPPGTGKTYNTVKYAVAIIENKDVSTIEEEIKNSSYDEIVARYREYKSNGQVVFTTFHQSYGYEEFIEGIKPVFDENSTGDIKYSIEPGIFKEFCERAESTKVLIAGKEELFLGEKKIWKISLGGAGKHPLKEECFKTGYIRVGFDSEDKIITEESECESNGVKSILLDFQDNMEIGDIVVSLYDQKTIDGIGIVTGEYEYDEKLAGYKRRRKVNWIIKDKKYDFYATNGKKNLTLRTVYRLSRVSIANLIDLIKENINTSQLIIEKNQKNYVFIIDEVNRGNISKIFGELITLIEESKRVGMSEEVKVALPYSKTDFGVPANVYILGTMNTADRSIALLDTALRRRFEFIEMMPDTTVLKNVTVEDIDVETMLVSINTRIKILYDREHTIGHAYFIKLVADPTLENLSLIFKNSIIPLLQEYFYEDYQKIQLVLGDNQTQDDNFKFIKTIKFGKGLFGNVNDMDVNLDRVIYEINPNAFTNKESYRKIYGA